MGKIVDEVRAQHLRTLQLLGGGIEAVDHFPDGTDGAQDFSRNNPGLVVAGGQTVQAFRHPVYGPQGEGAEKHRQQGAADEANEGNDAEEAQDTGVFHPPGQQAQPVRCQQNDADDAQGHQGHQKHTAGQQQRQGHAALLLFLHTFFTALYPRPRTETISNSGQASKRLRSRPI